MSKEEERAKLARVIRQWNNNRLDLFEISHPDENLEFHGVMRFCFADHDGGNVATKCMRVCSKSSTHEVIETLAEKFRPDMKMLTTSYSLYEIHANMAVCRSLTICMFDVISERKLNLDERPLVVQLNWSSDNREGRFVLKKEQQGSQENCHEKQKGGMIENFRRTLSRKDKKTEKKKTKSTDRFAGDENGSNEKPLNNTNKKIQHCTDNKKQQWHAAQVEEAFLSAVINYTNSSTLHFKLSPAYILYAVGRFALQQSSARASSPSGLTHSVTWITSQMVAMIGQKQQTIAGALAFWMANSSELLNFFKNDKDLCPLTGQSQLDLSHQVHRAYRCLRQCLQNELLKHLPTFLIDPEQHGPLPAGIEMVLNVLMNTMSLLRRCRVNPALTIQLFSQLFHFISAWLFNQLISPEANVHGLRSHYWGAALRQRLTAIEAWAERQGLELAADCHLGHIMQATTLLTMKKYSMLNLKDIQSTCFKLNSLQLQTLLSSYLCATNEPSIPTDLIDAVVTAAQASADHLIRSEGQDTQLEESLDLHLPFLLPEGGYSCDTVRGIPPGFTEFLEPICQKGLCAFTCHLNSQGDWTLYFSEQTPSAESTYSAPHREPEIVTITLNKPLNSGMGVSIVAAKGAGQDNLGIYIKSIVKGGPAEMNGRLKAGDQLLGVDGQSLIGLSQERAAAIMMQTGPVVTLRVAKFGASYHGLGALLSEPAAERPTANKSTAVLNSKALSLYSVVDPGPSEQPYESNIGKKEQIMQRNGQLYRSSPNVTTDTSLVDGDESVALSERGKNIAAVSSINICTDTFHREYSTLPNPKSQDKNISETRRSQQTFKLSSRPIDGQSFDKKTIMRQALSQENLCMDTGRPLLEKRQITCEQQDRSAKQTMNRYSSFPIRSSVSSHDILSDSSSPTKRQQGSHTSGAGMWRTPFSKLPTPASLIQPIRIDIPVTRAVQTQLNPPLSTFHSSSLLAVNMRQTSTVNGYNQSPQSKHLHIYASPTSATKNLPMLLMQSQQQTPNTHRGQSLSPAKHVLFREPPAQRKKGTSPLNQKDPHEFCDPWRREAREKLEKQQGLQMVELLQQEVQELQAKAQRSAEENNRLLKLNLEWQFQKRLREIQQSGEEEEGDLDMMVIIQQLDTLAQVKHQ
ncbi:Afadin Afadin adherens junction formation factor [Channa argus]|uniref:Afadin Afadin adherens junction formation factor n=1 Tax=Channa argus TaxID=215402 RepID=A0A6G1QEU1_CHAAH|nr:Afadin Afadin adherens junction formation factor [Channa argus]